MIIERSQRAARNGCDFSGLIWPMGRLLRSLPIRDRGSRSSTSSEVGTNGLDGGQRKSPETAAPVRMWFSAAQRPRLTSRSTRQPMLPSQPGRPFANGRSAAGYRAWTEVAPEAAQAA